MSQIKITTKTPEQIAAAFAGALKNFEATRPTLATRLEPYRAEIMKLRRRGYNWKQIAQIMADPQIGEKVQVKALTRVFGGKSETKPTAAESSVATGVQTAPASTPAAAPARRHLILDPATGQRIS